MMTIKNLGKYELHELLGSGATAEVYRARDNVLDREVALKLLKPALVMDSSAFERFAQEARFASKLFHPNIATVLDMGEAHGNYFIAMRYIPGRSLDKLLKEKGQLSWEETVRMAHQIGAALDFAHKQGFLHRDVKPSNIIRTPEGDFVLTDFGLTRAMMSTGLTSHTGAILGTPAYIAPEVWEGQEAGPPTDQYALACVVYEALTGEVLYSGNTPPAVMAKHFQPPHLSEAGLKKAPPQLAKVLPKALAREPGERYRNTGEFAAALGSLTGGQTAEVVKKLEEKPPKYGDRRQKEEIRLNKEEETREMPPAELRKRSIKWDWRATIGGLVVLAMLGMAIGIGFLNQAQKGHVPPVGLATRTSTQTLNPSPTLAISYTPTDTATRTLLPSLTFTPIVLATRTPGRPIIYTLQVGEFPYCIARRFNVNPADLFALNNISNGQILTPPVTLKIPQTGSFPGNTETHPHPTAYTVATNDTVYTVACYFGDVYPEDIIFQNKLTPPYSLQPGQILQIP